MRVFVVDDEPVIGQTLAVILKKSGYAAIAFTNPQAALESACVLAPDLLLSDVEMPQLSGIDLAIRIRAECPNCNILLLSGQAHTAGLLTAAREQGHEFTLLAKPIPPDELLQAIDALVTA